MIKFKKKGMINISSYSDDIENHLLLKFKRNMLSYRPRESVIPMELFYTFYCPEIDSIKTISGIMDEEDAYVYSLKYNSRLYGKRSLKIMSLRFNPNSLYTLDGRCSLKQLSEIEEV